jgi:hypothetical protein
LEEFAMTKYLEDVSVTLTTQTVVRNSGVPFSWNEILPGDPLASAASDQRSKKSKEEHKPDQKSRKAKHFPESR